ncbi:shikimate kinase [uncultured Ilyobacter sp.]|uniref:shikimate kinase n=1 Tax=uncultured Ilyobacter sp. TaxID=544433 RepID=UPI0029F50898|nr:shikimate kinase [uncultured Ilyobacter sp.]
MKDNIALIGFMGSGKTTVGRQLAKALEMKFVDIDKLIAAKESKNISEIFSEKGEGYFRRLEKQIVVEESKDNNVIISTGGGVIIDNDNIKNLRKTSFVVFLDCEIECIYNRVKRRKNRPLLNVENMYETIQELYEMRKVLYKISSDFRVEIDSDTNIYDTVDKIKEAYINS